MTIDIDKIKEYVDLGLIKENSHPDNPKIKIYNYTNECQYDRKWDDITINCRGLIINTETNEILARPFKKFFNLQEHIDVFKKEIPTEDPIIAEKLDGSLGILYWIDDEPFIATRGSFTSDQALWATNWFRKNINYRDLPRDITLLFEIIYKENRIVVDYAFEGLVFLASIGIKSGKQVGYKPADVQVVNYIEKTNIHELAELAIDNAEGFVVYYAKADLRLKIKFAEYVRLHKILTGLSSIGVWEYLKINGPDSDIRKIAEDLPDEFYDWLDTTASNIVSDYKEIETVCLKDFLEIMKEADNARKVLASNITTKKYPGILFLMLDSKDYSNVIWKLVRPKMSVS